MSNPPASFVKGAGALGGGKDLQQQPPPSGLRYPTSGKTIYHRPLNRTKTAELSQASFAYLFSEMVSYASKKIESIQDLEKRCVFPPTSHPLPLRSEALALLPLSPGNGSHVYVLN